MSLRKILEKRKTLILEEPLIKRFSSSSSGTKKAYAIVYKIPDEVTTVKEANNWLWEKMKRAVEKGWIELLPSIDIYDFAE